MTSPREEQQRRRAVQNALRLLSSGTAYTRRALFHTYKGKTDAWQFKVLQRMQDQNFVRMTGNTGAHSCAYTAENPDLMQTLSHDDGAVTGLLWPSKAPISLEDLPAIEQDLLPSASSEEEEEHAKTNGAPNGENPVVSGRSRRSVPPSPMPNGEAEEADSESPSDEELKALLLKALVGNIQAIKGLSDVLKGQEALLKEVNSRLLAVDSATRESVEILRKLL